MVEVVRWHTFIGCTSPRCFLIFIALKFNYTWHVLTFFESILPSWFGTYIILFEVVMEVIYWEACSILGGPRVWILHANYLVFFQILEIILRGWTYWRLLHFYFWRLSWSAYLWRLLLSILGLTTCLPVECSNYLASCTFMHRAGCLEIHTCGLVASILWTFCCFWRRLLCSIHLGGLLYCLFSHASWRVH